MKLATALSAAFLAFLVLWLIFVGFGWTATWLAIFPLAAGIAAATMAWKRYPEPAPALLPKPPPPPGPGLARPPPARKTARPKRAA